jgi:hypothetical protein
MKHTLSTKRRRLTVAAAFSMSAMLVALMAGHWRAQAQAPKKIGGVLAMAWDLQNDGIVAASGFINLMSNNVAIDEGLWFTTGGSTIHLPPGLGEWQWGVGQGVVIRTAHSSGDSPIVWIRTSHLNEVGGKLKGTAHLDGYASMAALLAGHPPSTQVEILNEQGTPVIAK